MMDLYIKFIDGEGFAVTNVLNYYITDDGFWKIVDNDGRAIFLNKDKVKYIGDKSMYLY